MEYSRKYLAIGVISYRKIWFKLSNCPDSNKWPNVLHLTKLAFCLPFTTSCVEQMFSRLKITKTKLRTGLDVDTLHDLLEISIEGPSLKHFDCQLC